MLIWFTQLFTAVSVAIFFIKFVRLIDVDNCVWTLRPAYRKLQLLNEHGYISKTGSYSMLQNYAVKDKINIAFTYFTEG